MNIGDWIVRQRRGVAHLVESIIDGDSVTNCGRRMKDEPNRDGVLVRTGPSGRTCDQCDPGEPEPETAP